MAENSNVIKFFENFHRKRAQKLYPLGPFPIQVIENCP